MRNRHSRKIDVASLSPLASHTIERGVSERLVERAACLCDRLDCLPVGERDARILDVRSTS